MTRTDEVDVLRAFPLPRALPVVASVAKPSISPRDGAPTSSQNRSYIKRFEDLPRGRAAADRGFASLAMTGIFPSIYEGLLSRYGSSPQAFAPQEIIMTASTSP